VRGAGSRKSQGLEYRVGDAPVPIGQNVVVPKSDDPITGRLEVFGSFCVLDSGVFVVRVAINLDDQPSG